jgi:hypothetical protein
VLHRPVEPALDFGKLLAGVAGAQGSYRNPRFEELRSLGKIREATLDERVPC